MDLEKLNKIKQNWHDVYESPDEGVKDLITEVQIAWDELKDTHTRVMELSGAFEEQKIHMDQMNEKLAEVDNILKMTGDEKLSVYLGYLLEKLKARHDEASKLRTEDKISEYTFTHLTFALELAYLAKEAYLLVLKEAAELDVVKEKQEDTADEN
jgi:hypothetical protein